MGAMRAIGRCSGGFLAALIGSMLGGAAVGQPVTVSPATLPRIATVDPRFQSYNVEMVEVTGGWFWKPYERARAATNAPAPPPGFDPERYDYRPPLDLGNPRLRALAAALGPSYVRVSGTWANFTYFHDAAGPAPARPPTGFQAVLTRAQWRGVVGFARAVNAEMVASPAVSLGTRDGQGAWTPAQARALFDYTRIIGGRIAAAEFMNEPNLPTLRGTLPSYDAGMFGRDVAAFGSLLKQVSPHTLYVGPGSAGEALVRGAAAPPLGSEQIGRAHV